MTSDHKQDSYNIKTRKYFVTEQFVNENHLESTMASQRLVAIVDDFDIDNENSGSELADSESEFDAEDSQDSEDVSNI